MKFVFLILFIFIIGFIIGGIDTTSNRDLFEIKKAEFEKNIENEEEITSIPLPIGDTSTKLAKKIEDKIYNTFKKILNKISDG